MEITYNLHYLCNDDISFSYLMLMICVWLLSLKNPTLSILDETSSPLIILYDRHISQKVF